MQSVYFEDLKVGDKWHSREYMLSVKDIKTYAQQYDPQPFHLDEAAAEHTFFEGLAASGWHTASITMRLMVESIPIASGLIGAGGEISWPRPTRPGDSLHIEAEVVELKPSRSKPDRGMVVVQINTLNQNGDCAQRFKCTMVAFRRPSDSV